MNENRGFEGKSNPKKAIITGAAQGIGFGVARRFAQLGYDLALIDRNEEKLKETQDELSPFSNVSTFPFDVTQTSDIDGVILQCEKTLAGKIDVFVHAAGVMLTKPFFDILPEEWDRVNDVNLKSAFFFMQSVAKRMAEQRFGSIIHISSTAGIRHRPLAAAYAASKAGVVSITKSASLALAEWGIRVNCVCPGVVETPMMKQIYQDRANLWTTTPEEVKQELVRKIPLGYVASEMEIADVVSFLASDDSRYVTGQIIAVDGGYDL